MLFEGLHPRSLTARPWKMMVGRRSLPIGFWWLFRGELLNLRGYVTFRECIRIQFGSSAVAFGSILFHARETAESERWQMDMFTMKQQAVENKWLVHVDGTMISFHGIQILYFFGFLIVANVGLQMIWTLHFWCLYMCVCALFLSIPFAI